MEKNIKRNFIEFDYQIWVTLASDTKIRKVLRDNMKTYPSISEIIELEEVRNYIKLVK